MATTSKPRERAFDAIRGIAILLVVLAHSAGNGWAFLHETEGRWNFYASFFMRHVCLCALPAFLFVSGYWLGGLEFRSAQDYWMFLRKRVSRIVIPYLIWSTFFFLLSSARTHSFSTSDFLVRLLLGQVEGPYFFIVMLIQFYVLTPFFIFAAKKAGPALAVVAVHVVFVIFLYWLRLYHFKDLSFSIVKLPFLSWMSFFLLGVWLRRHPETGDNLRAPLLAVLAGCFLLLSVGEGLFLLHLDPNCFETAISDIKFSCFGYATCALLMMYALRHQSWPGILVLLGEYSFGIFFIHGIILRGLMALLKTIGPLFAIQPAYQLLVTALTLTITCGIVFCTRKVIGDKPAREWLGF